MTAVLTAGLMVYAITFIITMSQIMLPVRKQIRDILDAVGEKNSKTMVRRDAEGEVIITDPEDDDGGEGYDAISCRMCVGFWVTLIVCLWTLSFTDTLAAYGFSYFLATQERP